MNRSVELKASTILLSGLKGRVTIALREELPACLAEALIMGYRYYVIWIRAVSYPFIDSEWPLIKSEVQRKHG